MNVNDVKVPPGEFPHPPRVGQRYKAQAAVWGKDLDKLKLTLECEVRDFIIDYGSRGEIERHQFLLNEKRAKGSFGANWNYRFITLTEMVACLWCRQAVNRINRTEPTFVSVMVVENPDAPYGHEFIVTCSDKNDKLEAELRRRTFTLQNRRDRLFLSRLRDHLDKQRLDGARRTLR